MAVFMEEAAVAAISQEEIAQRVAVLRRFRTLLSRQRDRFRSYLEVLDKEQASIESGSASDLLAHVELEEKIVADIFSIQKVIDPLDDMYRTLVSTSGASRTEDDVPCLKAALEDLKNEAIIRSSRNRELLSCRMAELRTEILALRNNPFAAKARRSSLSGGNTASLVDIQG
jgi:hypothetical protein